MASIRPTRLQFDPPKLAVQNRPTPLLDPVSPTVSSAFKRKTMSISQTYFLAHKARGKLSAEAARPAHNLRVLVGHANLLDALMLELADAEREQESWFNQSVRGASASHRSQHSSQDPRHIKWADAVVEDPEEDWQVEDADSDSSDSDSDREDADVEMADGDVPLRRIPAHKEVPSLQRQSSMYDHVEADDDEDLADLTLTRSPSHSSPPELDHDSDSSEDEAMPPSPPTTMLPTFSEEQKQSIATTAFYNSKEVNKDAFYDDGFYLPPRSPARLAAAIRVY